MLRALAIETSGRIGSIALVEAGRVLAEQQFEHGLQNAAKIIVIIDEAVRAAGWRPRSIQHVYLSIGPGSFTGLRIGTTIAKTMWLAGGAKIVAVPTVRVLAENAPADAAHVLIVLDAKRDQIFTARFEHVSGSWMEREPAHLDSLTAALSRSPRPIWLLGEGIPFHRQFIPDDAGVLLTHPDAWRGRASMVARLGFQMAERDEFADPLSLSPLYVRLPEAEEKRLAAESSASHTAPGGN